MNFKKDTLLLGIALTSPFIIFFLNFYIFNFGKFFAKLVDDSIFDTGLINYIVVVGFHLAGGLIALSFLDKTWMYKIIAILIYIPIFCIALSIFGLLFSCKYGGVCL